MKIAIIGSRSLNIENLEEYIPLDAKEIISGGAKGIDACAATYARKKGLKLTEILPDYKRYGKGAPLIRNLDIINLADYVLAFWDGKSHGTAQVIKNCKLKNKKVTVILPDTVTK